MTDEPESPAVSAVDRIIERIMRADNISRPEAERLFVSLNRALDMQESPEEKLEEFVQLMEKESQERRSSKPDES